MDRITKEDFATACEKIGMTGCADYMWSEVEDAAATNISIEGLADIYWNHPGTFRVLRDAGRTIKELRDLRAVAVRKTSEVQDAMFKQTAKVNELERRLEAETRRADQLELALYQIKNIARTHAPDSKEDAQ